MLPTLIAILALLCSLLGAKLIFRLFGLYATFAPLVRWVMGARSGDEPPPNSSQSMVQCCHCKLYIPAQDAITYMDNKFCSQQHVKEYTARDKSL